MIREQEIDQAEQNYLVTILMSDWFSASVKSFRNGALWADQHPREGLWDAEKACEILHEIINSDTIVQYLIFDDENIDFDSELFFDDLRKAMED